MAQSVVEGGEKSAFEPTSPLPKIALSGTGSNGNIDSVLSSSDNQSGSDHRLNESDNLLL